MKEFIEILYLLFDVKKGDGEEELKSSFRHLAFQFHPDHNNISPNIFMAISKGYEILIDEHKKENSPNKPEKKKGPPTNLTDTDINEFAIKKLKNTFRILLEQESPDKLLNLNVVAYIKKLFNEDTKSLNQANTKIRKDKENYIKFKKRIKCKSDSLSLNIIVDEIIEDRVRMIKKNKNKIKINTVAFELLKGYSFEELFEEMFESTLQMMRMG